ASGDKLLGGPQCGIIAGRADLVDPIRRHPLARAVRVDKLTLAALSATLNIYLRDAAEREVPTIALLAASVDALRDRAERIRSEIGDPTPLHIAIGPDTAPVGGGALPTAELPTIVLHVEHPHHSANELARMLRCGSIPVFPRVQNDRVLIDLRSVLPDDDSRVALALRLLAKHTASA
ncbi:MAG TPA: L-seryl-tRNA(Sec) selenium transferase, partial [Planctomycetaceae bacterium]|nr:L-seryl-tRNA(Sec) selenium transferase [Planctomycetaceae bacterium]